MIPKPPKRLPRPLAPELDHRLQALLEETDDLAYKAILLIRRTGLRISELRKLEFDCIDYDLKNRPRLKVPVVKLGVERRVPLDPKTVELIRLIQKKSLQNYRRNRLPKLLVIGPKGRPPPYTSYSSALTELCARLNTKKWINLHALRHTYATSLLAAGVSIVSLKEILGHKTIVMTLLYAKVTQEQIQSEYTKAITQMDARGIPSVLAPRPHDTGTLFSDLGASIMKTLDQSTDSKTRNRLKSLLNRVSRIKSELNQLGNTAQN
jgi:integrase